MNHHRRAGAILAAVRAASLAAIPAAILAAVLVVTPVAGSAHADEASGLVLECRRHTDNTARLACYDAVADRLASAVADDDAENPARAPRANQRPQADSEAGTETEEIAVTVVDCRRLYDNDYLFTLANGEFWRQTGGGRLRLGDCNFDATISKDFFGYKMTFDQGGRTVRVKQVQ